MLSNAVEAVDHVVAMDSLIHYRLEDVLRIVTRFSAGARRSVLFTSAPWTPALGAMHFVGRLIPHRSHRAPAIEPVHTDQLLEALNRALGPDGWSTARTHRVTSGFYISQAIELRRSCAV
jgi:magnesium-protoporphyrin O-methyltransferase